MVNLYGSELRLSMCDTNENVVVVVIVDVAVDRQLTNKIITMYYIYPVVDNLMS